METVGVTCGQRLVHVAHLAGDVRVRRNPVAGGPVRGRDDQIDPGMLRKSR